MPPTQELAEPLARVEALLARAARDTRDPLLARMALETVGSGGKRVRPRVLVLSYQACGGDGATEQVVEAAVGMELIHAATLVHDDIIDRSRTRRGAPSTQHAHGPDRAIIAGDFLFTKGFAFAARLDATVVGLTAEACTRLAEGELLELAGTALPDLQLDTYLKVIELKTAAPIEACGRVGAHLAGRDDWMEPLGAYGRHFGIAFQVTDDLLDVVGDPARTGKPRGNDLRNGAPNAPVLLALHNGGRAKLERMLRQRSLSEAQVQQAIAAIVDSGAADEARELAQEHVDLALAALGPLPASPARARLEGLARELPERLR